MYGESTEAENHFRDLGFCDIEHIAKSAPINCNQARQEVVDTAKRGRPEWFFVGNYDATVGEACRIYTLVCAVMPENRG